MCLIVSLVSLISNDRNKYAASTKLCFCHAFSVPRLVITLFIGMDSYQLAHLATLLKSYTLDCKKKQKKKEMR